MARHAECGGGPKFCKKTNKTMLVEGNIPLATGEVNEGLTDHTCLKQTLGVVPKELHVYRNNKFSWVTKFKILSDLEAYRGYV